MDHQTLRQLVRTSLVDLSTDEGINASGKDEIYGCIFGRDSAITILKILKAHQRYPDESLLEVCKKSLLKLSTLQGKDFNLESGEQPGKFVHEYRKDKYEHLLQGEKPWYLYPDKTIRNYDSLDSTPLGLIAIYRFWEITHDDEFLKKVLPIVEAGLNWIITFGDLDKDLLLEYELSVDRKHGGLQVQSWTDSHESVRQIDGKIPKYPIAPIEVQGYAWLALKLWADFYALSSTEFSIKLSSQAEKMKDVFNKLFIFNDSGFHYGTQALDGDKNQIRTITGNPLLLLWASCERKGKWESIINEEYLMDFVERGFCDDLFDKDGGIRTMSTLSQTYNSKQDSYHNGSFWPVLNGLIHEGLVNWGFLDKALLLKEASLKPFAYFQSPIELYMKDEKGQYCEYMAPSGQLGCRVQAWSAAVALDLLTG